MDIPFREQEPLQTPEPEVQSHLLKNLIKAAPQGFLHLFEAARKRFTRIVIGLTIVTAISFLADDTRAFISSTFSGVDQKVQGFLGSYPDENEDVCAYDSYYFKVGGFNLKKIPAGAVKKGSQAAAFVENSGGKLVCDE